MEGPQPGLPEAKRGCNLRRETCGFSPALAGAENATAGSKASRSDEGALSPKLEALSQRTCELRKVPCNPHCVRSSGYACAVRFALRIASGSPGKKATLTAFVPSPAATLSCSPSESPTVLRENRRCSPASAGTELTAPPSGSIWFSMFTSSASAAAR